MITASFSIIKDLGTDFVIVPDEQEFMLSFEGKLLKKITSDEYYYADICGRLLICWSEQMDKYFICLKNHTIHNISTWEVTTLRKLSQTPYLDEFEDIELLHAWLLI